MRFLLLNQTFYPDVMATGQYLGEVAVALVQQGHEVTVVTSRRAYDDPARIFPKAETWKGVRILRIGSTGFGKAVSCANCEGHLQDSHTLRLWLNGRRSEA